MGGLRVLSAELLKIDQPFEEFAPRKRFTCRP
jgi:hypothetical protein